MALRRPRRLQLQQLEDRTTPAVTTRLVGGLLTIRSDNFGQTLVIAETTTPGLFAVSNKVGLGPTKAVGAFKFSSLSVTMGNGNDTVDLRVKTALTGNLNVQLGNGGDTFTTASSTLGSRLGGNAFINFGLGQIRPGLYDQNVNWENVNVGGGLTVLGPAGSGAELVNIEAVRIGNSISVTNIYQTSLGQFDDPARAVTVGRDVTVSNFRKNTDTRSDTPFQLGGNQLNLYSDALVNGNVNYTGGNGIDRVYTPQDFANDTPVTIRGDVTVSLGEGTNSLVMGTGKVGAFVGGDVRFYGGSGIDRLLCDSGTVIDGDLFLSLGAGDNQVFGDSVGLGASGMPVNAEGDCTINGNVTVLLGNGDNFIGTFGFFGNTFTAGGDLTFRFGNGDNTGGDASSPGAFTFFNTALSVGGTATYRAGTGSNSLDITNQTIGDLVLLFRGGPTTVLFNQTAPPVFNGDVFLDFGVGFGPKTLGGSAAFGGPVTILNYP